MIQNFSEISHSSAVLLYDGIVVLEISHSSAVLYDCIVVFDSSSESSVGIASIPRSSVTITLIVFSSSFGGSYRLSAKSGRQRLLVLRAAYCSTLNKAFPIKSD